VALNRQDPLEPTKISTTFYSLQLPASFGTIRQLLDFNIKLPTKPASRLTLEKMNAHSFSQDISYKMLADDCQEISSHPGDVHS
jgi:hypothetical protein